MRVESQTFDEAAHTCDSLAQVAREKLSDFVRRTMNRCGFAGHKPQFQTCIFKQIKQHEGISLENVFSQRYLRSLCMENRPFASPNPEKMTIYHYKTNIMEEPFRGMPVVLNFTDSQSFLKCCKHEGQAVLQVEACDKERLKLIQGQDESALAFLFYMKGNSSGERKFESVLCPGWFIRVLNQETVQIDSQTACMDDASFYFLIQLT